MLRAGYGGLVLCAKREEAAMWKGYAKRTRRSGDLIVVNGDADCPYKLNVFDYEFSQGKSGHRSIESMVLLFDLLAELGRKKSSGADGGGDSAFFVNAAQQLTRHALTLVVAGTGQARLEDVYKLIESAPERPEYVSNPSWQQSSYCYQLIDRAKNTPRAPLEQRDFDRAATYFLSAFPAIAERTRSGITTTFTAVADKFLSGLLYERFSDETTFVPDLASSGKIFLVDLNLRDYGEVGRLGQIIFKFCFQRAMERRRIEERTRPVFLWADEAQCFLVENDNQFLTMSRSARVATVLLTQNISNLTLYMGGDQRAQTAADSLAALLSTKILHANSGNTNQWASDLIGREWQMRFNTQSGRSDFLLPQPGTGQSSSGTSDHFEYLLPPGEFCRLQKGGPPDWEAEAIVLQSGRVWQATGQPFVKVAFPQHRT